MIEKLVFRSRFLNELPRIAFQLNHTQNLVEKLVSDPFVKNQN